MDPTLCELFCQEYTKEMNRLHGEENAQQDDHRHAFKKVEGELDRLIQALMEGVPAARVKDKMVELEVRKAELEMRLNGSAKSTVLLHPTMANHYREEIGRLREALSEGTGSDALSHMRQLIDHVLLTPIEDEKGHKSLSVDLHGHLAGILAMGIKSRKPLEQSGPEIASIKLVAGERFTLNRPL
jgi:hypothetical protein